jgi:hypothetical protein
MRLVKIILIYGSFGLTACYGSSKMPIVKSKRYNSLTVIKPDNAAELRDGDVLKASFGASQLCCSIRTFYAQSIDRRRCCGIQTNQKRVRAQRAGLESWIRLYDFREAS